MDQPRYDRYWNLANKGLSLAEIYEEIAPDGRDPDCKDFGRHGSHTSGRLEALRQRARNERREEELVLAEFGFKRPSPLHRPFVQLAVAAIVLMFLLALFFVVRERVLEEETPRSLLNLLYQPQAREGWLQSVFAYPGLLPALVTGYAGMTALLFGLLQWRAARNEISLDKFYDRLDATNKKLDDWRVVRPFAGPWTADDVHLGDHRDAVYRSMMYVYRELDNLEYAIAKYHLGFMNSDNAHRSLRTFQVRCRASEQFCKLAERLVRENCGYDARTQYVVALSVFEARVYRANPHRATQEGVVKERANHKRFVRLPSITPRSRVHGA